MESLRTGLNLPFPALAQLDFSLPSTKCDKENTVPAGGRGGALPPYSGG